AAGAAEVISLLQPRLVVPMRYRTDAAAIELDPLDPFIKQLGSSAPEPQAKLSITRTNLPENTQAAGLDYRKVSTVSRQRSALSAVSAQHRRWRGQQLYETVCGELLTAES